MQYQSRDQPVYSENGAKTLNRPADNASCWRRQQTHPPPPFSRCVQHRPRYSHSRPISLTSHATDCTDRSPRRLVLVDPLQVLTRKRNSVNTAHQLYTSTAPNHTTTANLTRNNKLVSAAAHQLASYPSPSTQKWTDRVSYVTAHPSKAVVPTAMHYSV